MVDSVLVFRPGFKVTNAAGDPVNNAKIKFRQAGPGATRDVFSDSTLSTNLGHTIRTRADGYPVVSEGSNTTCLLYTGINPFHIEITDENDVALFPAKDNVTGALDTSDFLTSADETILGIPVLSKTGNYTAQATDKGKLLSCNAGGGFFTVTLPSAVTMGDEWNLGISNDGVSNPVGINAGQTIQTPMGAVTAFVLRPGETIWITSNGATYKSSGYKPPLISGTVGLILIADRLNDPPVGPTPGARYLVTAAPINGWSGYAEHDIVEADGQGGWIKITPPADCGWFGYVQDEDLYYVFNGSAWTRYPPLASDTVNGVQENATVAEVAAASAIDKTLVPARVLYSPYAAKAWAIADPAGNLVRDFGVASVVDGGTGLITFNFDNAFDHANNYVVIPGTQNPNGQLRIVQVTGKTTTSASLVTDNGSGVDSDPDYFQIAAFGVLA